jgi:hypothetical protein
MSTDSNKAGDAVLAAGATFVALLAVVAVADAPHRLPAEPAAALASEFTTGATVAVDAPQPVFALAPATGVYVDPGLQVSYDVHA